MDVQNKQAFGTEPPEQMSALVLAYLGDAVYELRVREYLIREGRAKVNYLHNEAVQFVRAATQAQVLRALEPALDETEQAVVRRGRNAKSQHVPKNSELMDYRYATALESLIGYLYLKGKFARIDEIFDQAIGVVRGGMS